MAEPDHKRCLGCGYILDGLPEPRCPECGGPLAETDATRCAYCSADLTAGAGDWVLESVDLPESVRIPEGPTRTQGQTEAMNVLTELMTGFKAKVKALFDKES